MRHCCAGVVLLQVLLLLKLELVELLLLDEELLLELERRGRLLVAVRGRLAQLKQARQQVAVSLRVLLSEKLQLLLLLVEKV